MRVLATSMVLLLSCASAADAPHPAMPNASPDETPSHPTLEGTGTGTGIDVDLDLLDLDLLDLDLPAKREPLLPSAPLALGEEIRAPRVGDVLVWFEGASDLETWRLDGESGHVVGRQRGMHVAVGHRTWTPKIEEKHSPLPSCERILRDQGAEPGSGGADGPGEEATLTRLSFVAEDDRQQLTGFETAESEVGRFAQSVELTGSVGPFVFFKTHTEVDRCGAHGNLAVVSGAWDLATQAEVDWSAELGPEEDVKRAARLELGEDVFEDDDDGPTLTALVPRAPLRGALELGRQMTMSACYACSDGLSSSYTRSAVVYRSDKLPRALAPWAEIPSVLRAFQSKHRGVITRGFSVVHAFRMD